MADVDVSIFTAVRVRGGVSVPRSGVVQGDPIPNPVNPENGGNNDFVRYDVATQGLNETERQNARTNISVVEQAPQSVAVTGARIDDLAITSKFLVFTGVNATNITGIASLGNGEMLNIYCDVTNGITILTQDTNSTAENRFAFNLTLRQGTAATLFYYENRWRLWQSGAFIIKGNADEVRFTTSWIGSGGANMIRIFNGASQTGAWNALGQITATLIAHDRSAGATNSVRRDELYLNYSETVATAGTINNLALGAGTKLLILTGSTDLTGVIGEAGRLLRIEARGVSPIIRNDSASSTAANRFSIGSDLTINDGEVYQFIYTNARWRRVL